MERNLVAEGNLSDGKNNDDISIAGRIQECYSCSWSVNNVGATYGKVIDLDCGGGGKYTFFSRTKGCGGGGGDGGGSSGGGLSGGGSGGAVGGGSGGEGMGGGGGSGSSSGQGSTRNPIGIKLPEDLYDQRLFQIKNILQQDPLKLIIIPCAQLAKWRNISSFKPPQTVIDKIKKLKLDYPSAEALFTGNFNIQHIQNASGTAVNLDYFPITINQLPKINGQPVTAAQFLEHIRLNINLFIDTKYSKFSPYNAVNTGVSEASLWASLNPVGAIIHIDIPGNSQIGDDGSVICSDYSKNMWKFTTVTAPYDWSHPVSGTREFGYETNADGTYTFYTRGVDRITKSLNELIAESKSFDEADNLWKSFQDKVQIYVTQNGGTAIKNPPIIGRPSWSFVDDVL
jgi:hypothetical protein